MTQQPTIDIYDNNNCFPFHTLANSEFETLGYTNRLSQSDMDRLSQLRFNPFQPNENIALSGNNIELDTTFNTNKIFCDYFLPQDFKRQIENSNIQTNFSLLHLNIRSIANKFDLFKNLIDTLDIPFQIIGLTETWLNDNNMDCFTLNEHKYFGSNRPNKKGGGVGLYVSKHLEYKSRNDLDKNVDNIIETRFIEVLNKCGKNIITGVVYRPPNGNFESFKRKMNEILEKIDRENKLCYLMGDFNIDLLKSEFCDYTNHFIEQLFTSSFFPLITKPTRITHHTATLIDNIFTNNLEELDESVNGIIFSDISDHLPIVHMFNTNIFSKNTTKNVNSVTYQRSFNKINTEAFKTLSWDNILNETNDPEKGYNEFLKMFLDLYEANFPLKRRQNNRKINKTKSPWMTNCILKSVRNKNKLHKTFLMDRNSKNEQLYKNYKNKLNHNKNGKKKYYEDQLIKHKRSSRMVWKTLNELLNKPKKNIKISQTFVETCSSNIIDDPLKIANHFNDYFINVGPNLANKIKQNDNNNFEKYLKGRCKSSFFLNPITENELEVELKNMKSNKSCGYDGICTNIVKLIATEISKPLAHIFNLTFSTGIIPNNLKVALITPVFKANDAMKFENYQPISVLVCFPKLLERLMINRLSKFIDKNKILSIWI